MAPRAGERAGDGGKRSPGSVKRSEEVTQVVKLKASTSRRRKERELCLSLRTCDGSVVVLDPEPSVKTNWSCLKFKGILLVLVSV